MSLSFPPGAINGQVYQGWVFDGEKWNPNWASKFVTSVNGKAGALMPADVIGAGNRVLVASKVTTAAVASLDMFYDFSTTTYDQYELDIYDCQTSSDNINIYMRVSTDGSTFLADSNYQYATVYTPNAPPSGYAQATGASASSAFMLGQGAGQSLYYTADIRARMSMWGTTDRWKYIMSSGVSSIGASVYLYVSTGLYGGATGKQPIKGISIIPTPGGGYTINRGVANLYGLVKNVGAG
jgi:hypothetical protein